MRAVKLNFTIPEDVVTMLKASVGERSRSRFVSEAIHEKLTRLEQEQLRHMLIEGYSARREEDAEVNKDWEGPSLREWGP